MYISMLLSEHLTWCDR